MAASWEKSLAAMKSEWNLSEEAIGLFALRLKFRLEDIQSIAADSITGGGDDKKCDIVYVDKELQVGIVAQCYYAKTKKPAASSNKASDLNTALAWLLTRDLDDLPEALKGRADEFRAAIKSGDIKQIYVWYVHNLPESHNVMSEMKTVEKSAMTALKSYKVGSDINIFAEEIGYNSIQRLYEQSERAVIVTESFKTKVPDAIVIESTDWSSVVTTVSAEWITSLYKTHGTDLFSANLRGYLGSRASDSNINNGIKNTAKEEPENFWVYNNGITALVIDYEVGSRRRSGRILTIQGISIVNGAQTTGSLGSIQGNDFKSAFVPIRFVKSSKETIINNVVRFNNSQNKLEAADFRSSDQIQDRLRREFEKIPNAEYEGGRRGGSSDSIKRKKYTLPSYTVGQSLSAFHGDPVTAYDKKSEIWTNETTYRRVFTDRTTARHIVFAYSLLEGINERRLALTQKAKKEDMALTSPEKMNLSFLNKKGSSYLLVHVISSCIETFLGKPISNRFSLRFRDNLSPEKASRIWEPIVDLILSLSNQLEPAFSRNRISNDSVHKAVPNFVGVIESLKQIHGVTFSEFASKVELAE